MRIDFQLGRPSGDARIVVAMSGGVDSSVTAALAARTGAEVIGVTLQLYDHGEAVRRSGACCAGQDIYDAKQVADRLGIAHYVLDYESRFRDGVIDRFVDEYARGPDAGAVRVVQPGREVRRPDRLRARARRRLPRDRPLCAARRQRRPRRAAQGRRPAPRPELFPLRHDARAARFPALPARATCPRTKCGGSPPSSGSRSRPSPTARTSASFPTAIMPGW